MIRLLLLAALVVALVGYCWGRRHDGGASAYHAAEWWLAGEQESVRRYSVVPDGCSPRDPRAVHMDVLSAAAPPAVHALARFRAEAWADWYSSPRRGDRPE